MNNELIISELSKAGQDAADAALLEQLERRRITPSKEIPAMQYLFQMFGKPCFPRGELVAVAGKPKSGKTFVCSILMTLCFREEVLTVNRRGEEALSVLWYDTEQSEESTQDILKNRILPMLEHPSSPPSEEGSTDAQALFAPSPSEGGPEGTFHIFNVRADFWQERLPLLEAAMRRYRPDLVVLDGIRDLVNDINDGVMAQDVIERLMHLASDIRCCLVCVLHQNKGHDDKNLRGWIGTELRNKAFEVYECTKDSDRIFCWSQTDSRKYDIVDKLMYTVGEDGIPRLCSVEQLLEASRTDTGASNGLLNSRPALNEKYVMGREGKHVQLDIGALFRDAFRPGEQKSAAALQETVMKMAGITSYTFYNRRREEALAQGIIEQARDGHGHIVYTCPAKPAAEPSAPLPAAPASPAGDAATQLNLFRNDEYLNPSDEPPF